MNISSLTIPASAGLAPKKFSAAELAAEASLRRSGESQDQRLSDV